MQKNNDLNSIDLPNNLNLFESKFEYSVKFQINLSDVHEINKESMSKNKNSFVYFLKVITYLLENNIFFKEKLSVESLSISNINATTAIESFQVNFYFNDLNEKNNIKNLFSRLITYSFEHSDNSTNAKLNGKKLYELTTLKDVFDEELIHKHMTPLIQYLLFKDYINPSSNHIINKTKIKI